MFLPFTDFFLKSHRILTRVYEGHRVSLVVMASMDITGYQAATVGMEQKAKRAWPALKDHVVKKEMREKMAQTLTTETGSSVHGRVMMTVTLVFSRYGMH